jgi:hypothetical protein
MTIQERKSKKAFLSDSIKNASDRIRAEFSLLKPDDQDVKPYIDMFNMLALDVLEEFAVAIKEDIDFFDVNKMKRTIDVCHTKFNEEKLKRNGKDLAEKIKLEEEVRAQHLKMKMKQ